jgi:hypothetical protein
LHADDFLDGLDIERVVLVGKPENHDMLFRRGLAGDFERLFDFERHGKFSLAMRASGPPGAS